MPSSFFEELGKAASRQIAKNIDAGRLAEMQRNTLDQHVRGGLAMDQAMSRRPMARGPSYSSDQDDPDNLDPRGGEYGQQNGNGNAPSAAECIAFVKLCAQKLVGPERDDFLMALTDLLSTEDGQGQDQGLPSNNMSAVDSRSGARGRRTAQDGALRSLQASSFRRRFPDAATVRFDGAGR